ncbi:MAG: YqgE/AlgH family protein [Candidatus Acidiferrales bacterium]
MRVAIFSIAASQGKDRIAFRCAFLLALFLFGLTPAFPGLAAQQNAPENKTSQNQGWFLVAHRGLSNPFFAKSTVLIVMTVAGKPDPGVVGLIVNKPTKMKLEELFPHARSVKKQDVTAYFGGPVDIHDVSAIFRASVTPKKAVHAMHIFDDVYVTFDPKSAEELVKKSKQPSELRIFLGRSQWTQPQLQHEMAIGAWYSTHHGADPIFASDPGTVWEALVDRMEPRPYVDYHLPRAQEATVLSRSAL